MPRSQARKICLGESSRITWFALVPCLADLLTTGGAGNRRAHRKAVTQSVERRRATADRRESRRPHGRPHPRRRVTAFPSTCASAAPSAGAHGP
jgi:hypothetical protein